MNARITRLWCAVCRTGFTSEGLDVFLEHDCTDYAGFKADRASFEVRFAVGLGGLVACWAIIVLLVGGAP